MRARELHAVRDGRANYSVFTVYTLARSFIEIRNLR